MLLSAPPQRSWSNSHVALPVLERTPENNLNLYYSPRDAQGRAHIARARLEVTPDGGLRVAAHDPDPVLGPGELGAFDDAGVTVSCVVEGEQGQGTLLYYTGWTLGVSVPFYFYAGLAVRASGQERFERVSRAPILERNAVDPYLTASPWVLRDQDGVWRMWYVSCARWEKDEDSAQPPRHYYHVRYAQSEDGVHWRREGRVAIDFKDAGEYALGRPCVLRESERYRMWFCARGERYRLAYASSADGLNWERSDGEVVFAPDSRAARAAGLPSFAEEEREWDSQMQAYPAVFVRGETRYLLYNGNGYGRSGVGYAVCSGESD
ncbi:MAG TPA: hypothetical protein VGY76_02085 [Solirubrobacteraceae bacterium]|nr:hypothetical protein [Solirubrobacteraceae bacterium]